METTTGFTTIMSVYRYLHELIKTDSNLLDKIKEFAIDSENRKSKKYIPTGLVIEGIYLGLDFMPLHIEKFKKIVVNTLFIEDISRNQADLSRVLLKVMIDGRHVANLTEDVSENGRYQIYDKGISFGPYMDYIGNFFGQEAIRSVFVVYKEGYFLPLINKKNRLENREPNIVRMPIIDLDHIEISNGERFYQTDNLHKDLFVLEL